jgi:hypothetical protein
MILRFLNQHWLELSGRFYDMTASFSGKSSTIHIAEGLRGLSSGLGAVLSLGKLSPDSEEKRTFNFGRAVCHKPRCD